jgi:uncharacterized glyoxalase superfamily protein PhnB
LRCSVYVEDVDYVFVRAIAAGAQAVQEPENHFYGDRVAMARQSDGATGVTAREARSAGCGPPRAS